MNTYGINAVSRMAIVTATSQPAYVGPVYAECVGHRIGQPGAVDGCHRFLPMTKYPTSPRSVGIIRRLLECRDCRDARTSAARDARTTATGSNATVPTGGTAPDPVNDGQPAWVGTVRGMALIATTPHTAGSSTDVAVRTMVERRSNMPFTVWANIANGNRPANVPVIPNGTPVPVGA